MSPLLFPFRIAILYPGIIFYKCESDQLRAPAIPLILPSTNKLQGCFFVVALRTKSHTLLVERPTSPLATRSQTPQSCSPCHSLLSGGSVLPQGPLACCSSCPGLPVPSFTWLTPTHSLSLTYLPKRGLPGMLCLNPTLLFHVSCHSFFSSTAPTMICSHAFDCVIPCLMSVSSYRRRTKSVSLLSFLSVPEVSHSAWDIIDAQEILDV